MTDQPTPQTDPLRKALAKAIDKVYRDHGEQWIGPDDAGDILAALSSSKRPTIEAQARTEALHSDGDVCTGLLCGNPEHGWTTTIEAQAHTEALDVDALAQALTLVQGGALASWRGRAPLIAERYAAIRAAKADR